MFIMTVKEMTALFKMKDTIDPLISDLCISYSSGYPASRTVNFCPLKSFLSSVTLKIVNKATLAAVLHLDLDCGKQNYVTWRDHYLWPSQHVIRHVRRAGIAIAVDDMPTCDAITIYSFLGSNLPLSTHCGQRAWDTITADDRTTLEVITI